MKSLASRPYVRVILLPLFFFTPSVYPHNIFVKKIKQELLKSLWRMWSSKWQSSYFGIKYLVTYKSGTQIEASWLGTLSPPISGNCTPSTRSSPECSGGELSTTLGWVGPLPICIYWLNRTTKKWVLWKVNIWLIFPDIISQTFKHFIEVIFAPQSNQYSVITPSVRWDKDNWCLSHCYAKFNN